MTASRSDEKNRAECVRLSFEIYPRIRKLMYKSFDQIEPGLTRTQQIIVLTLSQSGMMSMSELAARISTSNEQATRAVSQLVDKGFIERMQNKFNRRVVNIKLTDSGKDYVKQAQKAALQIGASRFDMLNESELQEFCATLEMLAGVLDKVDPK